MINRIILFIIAIICISNCYATSIYGQVYHIMPDFQVNETTGPNGADQDAPSIAINKNGIVLVVWSDKRNANRDVYAQIFSESGSTPGENFKVNDDHKSSSQLSPFVIADKNGDFIIAWVDTRNGTSDIFAQKFSENGSPLGSNFKINDDEGNVSQALPSIAPGRDGGFIIVWSDYRNDDADIYAQRFSKETISIGTNFKVNDDNLNLNQGASAIASDNSGNFTITWSDLRHGTYDIYAQMYTYDGQTIGTNFKVTEDDDGNVNQNRPAIAMNGTGIFLITWRHHSSDRAIFAQRFSADGSTLGGNFKINDNEAQIFIFSNTRASTDDNGNYVVAWVDERNNNQDIYAQRLLNDGTPIGTNFIVNDDEGNEPQNEHSISSEGNGNFILTWEDNRNGDPDIYLQRFSNDGNPLESNFKINDDEGSADQVSSSISIYDNGDYVITWWDARNGSSDIYAQRFRYDGTANGKNFIVNDDVGDAGKGRPKISSDSIGNFIITWRDFRFNDYDIFAQRFSYTGTALGPNFKVNDDAGNALQDNPTVSSTQNGDFIITWSDNRNSRNVYAQRYTKVGMPIGSNFKVNDGSTKAINPFISISNSGGFIITWISIEGTRAIYAQRFANDGSKLGSNFQVNDKESIIVNSSFALTVNQNGKFAIIWEDLREGCSNIFGQQYISDGSTIGGNFRVTNINNSKQSWPDAKLFNDRLYTTWTDDRAGGTGYDIWSNIVNLQNMKNINNDVTPESRLTFYNNSTNQFQFDLRVQNNSGTTIFPPIYLKLETLMSDPTGHPITVDNADGGGDGIGAFYDYSDSIGSDNKLIPGEFTEFKTWRFNDPHNVNFFFTADVLSGYESTVSLKEIEADITPFHFYVDIANEIITITKGTTDVNEPDLSEMPLEYSLRQNYPNPFNPTTTIEYIIPKTTIIKLAVHNLKGELIRLLVDEKQTEGLYSITWNGANDEGVSLPSGIYFIKLSTKEFTQTRKIQYLK